MIVTSETRLTSTAFYFSIIFYIFRRNSNPAFDENIITISTYLLIFTSALAVLVYMNQLKLFYFPSLGLLAFSTTYLGILLAGTSGLASTDSLVVEGLTRITLALFAIWKITSDMRNLKLQIDPFKEHRSRFKGAIYGILYPPKELLRLLKVLLYVIWIFYLITSGLDMLKTGNVDAGFLTQTEKISMNILFFGIQAPLMMSSRASVSKTFSEYLKNLDWVQSSLGPENKLSGRYRQIVHSTDISYDSINSNGKHLWIMVLITIVLQAAQKQLISVDLLSKDWAVGAFYWILFVWQAFTNLV